MSRLILTKGLPASGKTTWALEWKNKDTQNRVIVCRDDIRIEYSKTSSCDERPWNKSIESAVSDESRSRIEQQLISGKDVCVADTNLNPGTVQRLINIAEKLGVPYEFEDFTDVALIECLKRDSKRKCGRVGETVIISMWERYLKEQHNVAKQYFSHMKPFCIVSDIDGTIANNNHRSPYDYKMLGKDSPIHFTQHILKTNQFLMGDAIPIFYVSGRPDSVYNETKTWLTDYGFPVSKGYKSPDLYEGEEIADCLLMRKEGDKRPDYIIKEEIAKTIMEQYNILYWLDDRWSVTTHIRSLGINVLQVNFGRF